MLPAKLPFLRIQESCNCCPKFPAAMLRLPGNKISYPQLTLPVYSCQDLEVRLGWETSEASVGDCCSHASSEVAGGGWVFVDHYCFHQMLGHQLKTVAAVSSFRGETLAERVETVLSFSFGSDRFKFAGRPAKKNWLLSCDPVQLLSQHTYSRHNS